MLPCSLHVKQMCYYYTKLELLDKVVTIRDSNPALLDFTQTLSLESLIALKYGRFGEIRTHWSYNIGLQPIPALQLWRKPIY